jgi:hypothetical protein
MGEKTNRNTHEAFSPLLLDYETVYTSKEELSRKKIDKLQNYNKFYLIYQNNP